MTHTENPYGVTDIDMTEANKLPPRGEELIRLVIRFEYALKEIGFCRAGRSGAAEVRWDDFVNSGLDAAFLAKIEQADIANTILTMPPSRQVAIDKRECPKLCVSGLAHAGFRYGHALKRSSNIIAN